MPHSTIEGRLQEEGSAVPADSFASMLLQYLELVRGYPMPVSMIKGKSWGITEGIVPFAVEAEPYPPYAGETAAGLRVCSFIENRKTILLWDFHEQAFGSIPVRLVGHNPNMDGVAAAENWDELKQLLSQHPFYIHTADPQYEDGYDRSTLEAMAAGLPVLGNRHPSSPIEDGVSGFLSDDPMELRQRAEQLLADRELAAHMGQAARKAAIERFRIGDSHESFARSIEAARAKWAGRPAGNPSAPMPLSKV